MEINELRQTARKYGFWAENRPPVKFKDINPAWAFIKNQEVYIKLENNEARNVITKELKTFDGEELVLFIERQKLIPFNSAFHVGFYP